MWMHLKNLVFNSREARTASLMTVINVAKPIFFFFLSAVESF